MEQGHLTRYAGDYNYFMEQYEMKKMQQEAAYRKQQKEIEDLEDFIARNKARVATRNMAHSRQKKLDKMVMIEKPKTKLKPEFEFKTSRTSSKFIFEAEDLVIGYDEPLCKPMKISLERNKKVAIKGVNGIGKSTLLKTLLGITKPYSGNVEVDSFSNIGFYQQEENYGNETALQYIWDRFPQYENKEVRAALAKCALTSDHIESAMCVLSGGEQAKVRLCALMNKEYNVLVLDEPTNHLDQDAKEELKRALQAYSQTVILVSHDPWFYEDFVDEIINLEEYSLKIALQLKIVYLHNCK